MGSHPGQPTDDEVDAWHEAHQPSPPTTAPVEVVERLAEVLTLTAFEHDGSEEVCRRCGAYRHGPHNTIRRGLGEGPCPVEVALAAAAPYRKKG